MKRFCALVCLAAALFAACKDEQKGPDPAAVAAKAYYDSLAAGRYGGYLSGGAGADSLPASYREQLLANAKQFMAAVKEEHGGIQSVSIVRTDTGAVSHRRDVFLLVSFGDSVKEEVVVPMVESPAGWRMK